MYVRFLCLSFVLLLTLSARAERPNIVLVMVDDMGFSDLGCYGGEIDTPHLDRLGLEGLRFTQFYNCAKCETTRATLMSGQYYPEVDNRELKHCVTLAEAMRSSGYHTIMTGKWHLSSTPTERGFDRFFGHLSGACNFFLGDDTFQLDGKPYKVPGTGFYTTDANTKYALQFLEERPRDQPFFLYIAFNAPHYPLQAPQAEFEKYRGQYTMGWDALRKQRHARQQKLGLFPTPLPLLSRPDDVPAWDQLSTEEQDVQEMMMAAFAGMMDRVDQNIGQLRRYLEQSGDWDNTLFLFLSDNGACPFQRTQPATRAQKLMPYDPASYWTYDKGWAHAGNTPFREYKQNQHEGGICTPFIAHWPNHLKSAGAITAQPAHLVDIMATLVDLGEVHYPEHYAGHDVRPMRGRSLTPILAGETREPHPVLFQSFYGKNNAVRAGDWKLVNINHGEWELYNLAEDRNEQHNLADANPAQLKRMQARWAALVKDIPGAKGKLTSKRKSKK